MPKQLLFDSSAREGLLRGAAVVADAVRLTLGPKSKCVLIERRFGHPLVCNDGVTIAGGNKAAIANRCHELRRQIEDATSEYDTEKLKQRLAKLAGGVAVIRVGAPSEAEMKSRNEAFEDASVPPARLPKRASFPEEVSP